MNSPPELVDQVAARIRDLVRIHPGHNATAALTEGQPIILSGREAETAAIAALEAVEEARAAGPAPGTAAIRATRYTVCALPEDNVNARHFSLYVEYRGRDRWAVSDGFLCLGNDGEWEYESIPSERADEWLATHRFDLDTALNLARAAAPKVTVNGYTVADVLARADR
ncbi:hypothetical protein [Actinomadura sp. WMMA1423]|uniref:hypothetical protein n=1 Tax=Actinomadura sp. WMMA1423 TaxID=2591108 RepID=UPI0011472104|nr:hypothetical protein [Actinomadura sp. WMMA1423]